ncbi:MAG: glycosyltransferase family 4 protein [Bacteroides sp.]|nr:glycosyltransferase family 4 protein [Bacteroides sp.]
MRIGFDAKKIVSNLTGIGNYSRGVVNLLSNDDDYKCVLFAPDRGKDKCLAGLDPSENIEFIYSNSSSPVVKNYWRNFSMVKDIKASGIDLFHGLSNELPFGIAKAGCPTVVTIHDLIFLRYPQTYDWLSRKLLTIKTRYACRKADRIIAVSQQTKNDIVDFYGIAPEKIEVLYQGCHEVFKQKLSASRIAEVKKLYSLPDEYMISVGTIEHRKNHKTIIEALTKTKTDVPLVIISKKTSLQKKIEKEISALGLADRVKIINGVPLVHLPALYQGSRLAIYLSYFEGFGIPVLEGLFSGIPVIAATGSCLEEAGGNGAVYCNPFDTEEVANAMDKVLTDGILRENLISEGQRHAANFTDDVLAEKMKDFYVRFLGQE